MPSINKQRLRSLFVGEYGVIGILVGVIGAAYFVPTFAAIVQKRDNLPMICGVNALLGWTIVGWIVALM